MPGKPMHIYVQPETQALLAALAERWGLTKSATIAEALRRADGKEAT